VYDVMLSFFVATRGQQGGVAARKGCYGAFVSTQPGHFAGASRHVSLGNFVSVDQAGSPWNPASHLCRPSLRHRVCDSASRVV